MRMFRLCLPLVFVPVLLGCDDKKGGATVASASPLTTISPDKPISSEMASSTAKASAPPPSEVPSAVASANLTMKETSLDGFKMKTISCKVTQGNPFTSMTKLAPLAKQRTVLDACVDKQVEISIQVNVVDKKARDIRVGGAPTPAAATCIATAIESAPWDEPLSCVVRFDLKTAR